MPTREHPGSTRRIVREATMRLCTTLVRVSARIGVHLRPSSPAHRKQGGHERPQFEEHRRKQMKSYASAFAVSALVAVFGSAPARAQSSGNFSASGTPASCAIGTDGSFSGGTGVHIFSADISTSNASGVTLDIRPSLVTGLFTDTKISTAITKATADVGIRVCVTVDGSGAGILPTNCAVYDQRFQQISSNLFSQLTECTTARTNTACTTDANCDALGTGFSCSITPPATTGVCVGPNLLCDFDLILSTLSAHSFDFVVPVRKGKPHRIDATWSVIGSGATTGAHVASCVGPGILTVTQYKVFNNSGALLSF